MARGIVCALPLRLATAFAIALSTVCVLAVICGLSLGLAGAFAIALGILARSRSRPADPFAQLLGLHVTSTARLADVTMRPIAS